MAIPSAYLRRAREGRPRDTGPRAADSTAILSLEMSIEKLPPPPPQYLCVEGPTLVPVHNFGAIPSRRPRFPVWMYGLAVATTRAERFGIRLADLAAQPFVVRFADGTAVWRTHAGELLGVDPSDADSYEELISAYRYRHDSGVLGWNAIENVHVSSLPPSDAGTFLPNIGVDA